jgi:hypothetical protein
MKRIHLLTIAALAAAASPALAQGDVDFHPHGYLSSAIRATHASAVSVAATGADNDAALASAGKSRAQVVAETREAARLGLLNRTEAGPAEPTPEQSRRIEQAGLRALGIASASR